MSSIASGRLPTADRTGVMVWIYIGCGLMLACACLAGLIAFGPPNWKVAYIFQAYYWPKHEDGVIDCPPGYIGTWRGWYKDGAIMFTSVSYLEGERYVSNATAYWPSGTVNCISSLVDGAPHGPYELRYENGTVAVRGAYIRGKREGQWLYFHKDGTSREEREYSRGLPSGTWVEFWPNGKKKSEGQRREQRVGKWTFYHSSGGKREEGEYLLVMEDADGSLVPYKTGAQAPSMGVKHGRWRQWDEAGTLTGQTDWRYGEPVQQASREGLELRPQKPTLVQVLE